MNHIQFSKQFSFRVITHRSASHTDNSKGLERHYLAHMRQGSGRLVTEERETFLLRAGDLFYFPMGMRYHSYWTPDPESGVVEWSSYGFLTLPEETERDYSPQHIEVDGEVEELLRALSSFRGASAGAAGTLYLLLDHVLPHMAQTGGKRGRLMETVQSYMEEQTEFLVPELARLCGMSESGLYAYLKRQTGMTPLEMKNRIRVKHAKELLRTTDLSVEEIGERVGFGNPAYFRRLVKTYAGKTPQQIRRDKQLL